MSEYYTKSQNDAQATVIGQRIKSNTQAQTVKARYESNTDTNAFTDAEKQKLAGLEGSKYRGLFTLVENLPLTGNDIGFFADVDLGSGADVVRYIWDHSDSKWVLQSGAVTAETAVSVKTKYEANADTNCFTNGHKLKLELIADAANISVFTANLDAALA